MRTRSGNIAITVMVLLTLFISADPADACVGRKLVLGSLETDRQGMVSRILTVLIRERTGTTVEVKFFSSEAKLLEAVKKEKVDLYVDFVDSALQRLEHSTEGLADEDRFRQVKRVFDEEFNLVWLKPMGFTGSTDSSRGQAATVVHKGSLKKFPALPRLLEKIGTRVVLDNNLLDDLVRKGQSKKPAKVAREFLKEVKLI